MLSPEQEKEISDKLVQAYVELELAKRIDRITARTEALKDRAKKRLLKQEGISDGHQAT